jgi:hypothetical protein
VGEGEEAGEISIMVLMGAGVAGVDILWLVGVVDGEWGFIENKAALIAG